MKQVFVLKSMAIGSSINSHPSQNGCEWLTLEEPYKFTPSWLMLSGERAASKSGKSWVAVCSEASVVTAWMEGCIGVLGFARAERALIAGWIGAGGMEVSTPSLVSVTVAGWAGSICAPGVSVSNWDSSSCRFCCWAEVDWMKLGSANVLIDGVC